MGLIRLILALIVAGDHFTVINLSRGGIRQGSISQWIGMTGGYAVTFFYVISGFLISYVLAHKYPNSAQGTLGFYRSRFVRIYSLYWPALIFCVLVFGGMQGRTLIDYLISIGIVTGDWVLAFSAYPIERTPYPDALGQIWSVAAELTFYAMAPYLVRSFRATAICLVLSLTSRVALEAQFGFHQAWDYHFFPTALWFFLLGNLARVMHDTWLRIPLAGALCLLGLSAYLVRFPFHSGGFPTVDFYLAIIAFAFALPRIFDATKDNRLLNLLGDASYPVYLTHMMLLTLIWPIGPIPLPFTSRVFSIAAPPLLVMCFLVAATVVGIAVHFVVERPAAKATNWLIDTLAARAKLISRVGGKKAVASIKS